MFASHQPGCRERLVHDADGGITVHNRWESFIPDQLTRPIDDFADNGVEQKISDFDRLPRGFKGASNIGWRRATSRQLPIAKMILQRIIRLTNVVP